MTTERLALAELMEKAGDSDFLRAVAEAAGPVAGLSDPDDDSRRSIAAYYAAHPDADGLEVFDE